MKAEVRVELRINDEADTFVTMMPISQLDEVGVEMATGQCFAMFMRSLYRTPSSEINRYLFNKGIIASPK